jgi:glycosyltransferase involved in cell wall biosynthesis
MDHSEFVARYEVPVLVPGAPRPALQWSRRGEGRARALLGRARRARHGKRLAYIDSHFPWRRSGFRYADALALLHARPDTVFFSMYEMREPFPAPVLPLAQFPRLAPSLGVTDVYGVFLDFMAGVVGLRRDAAGPPAAIEGLDLSGVVRGEGMRVHAGLHPGGGFTVTPAGLAEARRLVEATDQVFSWAPAVLEHVPEVKAIEPAIIDTAFYAATVRDFGARPLQLLFVADAKPRKGLDVALAAMRELAGEPLHLHVVGPHAPPASPDPRVTYHGWLDPHALRELHARCDAFLSPVRHERPDDPAGDGGVTDGFPTAAAAEAASSGCLLISANPDGDRRVMRPGVDHLEPAATADAFASAIVGVLADPGAAAAVAESGARRVRERLDVRVGAAARLALMGFAPTRAPAPPAGEAEAATVQIRSLSAAVQGLAHEQRQLREELRETRRDLTELGRLALDDEPATRRLLAAARSAPGYEEAFADARPLVSICIPTYTHHELLLERAIPSALAQDHPEIEVIVVGDTAPPETAEGIARLGDPRVHYENLAVRGPYPEDPRLRWYVAGTGPLNRSMALARGTWIAILNDDDALRPHHVSTLLAAARESRAEVAYGRLLQHAPDGATELLGTFPPVNHAFGWQLALQHRAMRLFEYELAAALFDEPGDWHRCRRMLRAGVRFSMVDEVVCDYFPSFLWKGPPA